jgi:hypothetical protein
MSYSKYRNVYGEVKRDKFSDMDICEMSSEGQLMAANTNFLAISWNSSGGSVAIFQANNPMRCPANLPLVRGHKSAVVDVKFSPFRSDLMATASNDCTVKLWEIPHDGLTEDINEELQNYSGHGRKVSFVNFNPVCSDLIASASFDNTVHVWNMLKAEKISKVTLKEYPTSMEWNYNGSLICCTSKDKNIYVCDPRADKIIITSKAHDSPKTMKMTWVGEHQIISTGFNKSNTREMKLWDIRKVKDDLSIESPVQNLTIDHQSGIPTPYFDYDIKLLFVFGRGEGNMHFYDLNDGTVKPCNDYLSSDPTDSIVMFDKKSMDYNKCELDRFAKYSKKNIFYLSFNYPKKNPDFDESLYPPTFSGEPALTLDEWMGGSNKDPLKKDIRQIENKWVSQSQSFEKKIEPSPEEIAKSDKEKRGELENQIVKLTKRINELEIENQKLKKEIQKAKSMGSTTTEMPKYEEKLPSTEIPKNEEEQPPSTKMPVNEEGPTTLTEMPKNEEEQPLTKMPVNEEGQTTLTEMPVNEEEQPPSTKMPVNEEGPTTLTEIPKNEEEQQPLTEMPKNEEGETPLTEMPKKEEGETQITEMPKNEEGETPLTEIHENDGNTDL